MKTYLKYFFYILIAYFVLETPWKVFHSEKSSGWDHEIYCRADAAIERGKDPYLTENLGMEYSYAYPITFLDVYKPLCPEESHKYIWVHFAFILAMIFLMVRFLNTDLFLTMGWLSFGFNSAYVNYRAGNIGTFEAFFFVLFLVFYTRDKWWSTLLLVPSAFVKVVPTAMIAVPVVANLKNKKSAFIQGLVFTSGLIIVNMVTYFVNPDLYFSFLKQMLGLHPNQHSPAGEMDSNPSNMSIILFFRNLGLELAPNFYYLPLAIFLVGLLFYSYWLWKRSIRNESDRLIQICWYFLILILWLPRLKPYSLMIACVALLPILQKKSRIFGFGILLLSIFHRVINGDKSNHLWYFVSNNTAVYAYLVILYWVATTKSKASAS